MTDTFIPTLETLFSVVEPPIGVGFQGAPAIPAGTPNLVSYVGPWIPIACAAIAAYAAFASAADPAGEMVVQFAHDLATGPVNATSVTWAGGLAGSPILTFDTEPYAFCRVIIAAPSGAAVSGFSCTVLAVPALESSQVISGGSSETGPFDKSFTSIVVAAANVNPMVAGVLYIINPGCTTLTLPALINTGDVFGVVNGGAAQANELSVQDATGTRINGIASQFLLQSPLGPSDAGLATFRAITPTFLYTDGLGTDGGFGFSANGILTANSGLILHEGAITADYVTVADAIGIVCRPAVSLTVTLTSAGFAAGHVYIVVNEGPGTVALAGAADTPSLPPHSSVILYLTYNGATPSWHTAAGFNIPVTPGPAALPAGWTSQSLPRQLAGTNTGTMVSGTLKLVQVYLPAGTVVGHLSFVTGSTAAVAPTSWWMALFDSTLNMLAHTADLGAAPLNASVVATEPITTTAAGAAATFTTTYSGFYYVGIVVVATTVPTLGSGATVTNLALLAPALIITGNAGMTTGPPAFPFQSTSAAGTGNVPYVGTS